VTSTHQKVSTRRVRLAQPQTHLWRQGGIRRDAAARHSGAATRRDARTSSLTMLSGTSRPRSLYDCARGERCESQVANNHGQRTAQTQTGTTPAAQPPTTAHASWRGVQCTAAPHLHLLARRRAALDVVPNHIASRDHRDAQLRREHARERALPHARRAHEHDFHRGVTTSGQHTCGHGPAGGLSGATLTSCCSSASARCVMENRPPMHGAAPGTARRVPKRKPEAVGSGSGASLTGITVQEHYKRMKDSLVEVRLYAGAARCRAAGIVVAVV
jgi:hypothetical protein